LSSRFSCRDVLGANKAQSHLDIFFCNLRNGKPVIRTEPDVYPGGHRDDCTRRQGNVFDDELAGIETIIQYLT
jgi:hypothetical protein